jgi:hypothetical protein
MIAQNKAFATAVPIDSSLQGLAEKPAEPTVRKLQTAAYTEPLVKKMPTSTPQITTTPTEKPTEPTVKPHDMTYTEMYERLNQYKPLTKEEIEAERRKAKSRETIAAIGDGISAISNLFFATKGAPNMYNEQNAIAPKYRARYEQLVKDRETNDRYYLEQRLRMRQLDKADERQCAQDERQAKRDAESDRRQAVAEERQRNKDKWEYQYKQLQNAYLEGKINAQEYDTMRKKIDAEYEEGVKKSIINRNNRTGIGKKSASGSYNANNGYLWYDKDGGEHYAKTFGIARQNGIAAGTWENSTEISTTTTIKQTDEGTETSNSTTSKAGKGYPAKPAQQSGSEKDSYKRSKGKSSASQPQSNKSRSKVPLE